MNFFIEGDNPEEIDIYDEIFLYNLSDGMTQHVIFFISCFIDNEAGIKPLQSFKENRLFKIE